MEWLTCNNFVIFRLVELTIFLVDLCLYSISGLFVYFYVCLSGLILDVASCIQHWKFRWILRLLQVINVLRSPIIILGCFFNILFIYSFVTLVMDIEVIFYVFYFYVLACKWKDWIVSWMLCTVYIFLNIYIYSEGSQVWRKVYYMDRRKEITDNKSTFLRILLVNRSYVYIIIQIGY